MTRMQTMRRAVRESTAWTVLRVFAGAAGCALLVSCSGATSAPAAQSAASSAAGPASPPAINNYFGTESPGADEVSIDDASFGITDSFGPGIFTRDLGFERYTASSQGYAYGYALEIPGEAVLLDPSSPTISQEPLVVAAAGNACAVLSGKVEFEYVAISDQPATYGATTIEQAPAYGTFVASTSADGSQWTFSEASQSLLGGGAADALNAFASSIAGACAQGVNGFVVSVPATLAYETTETIAVGPSGFMVDDQSGLDPAPALVGFAAPATPVVAANVAAATYLGFMTESSSVGGSHNVSPVVFNEAVAGSQSAIAGATFSVGASGLAAPTTKNMVLALGAQDQQTNGLFPSATITVPDPNQGCSGTGVPSKDSFGDPNCTFPAAAIVGNPGGRFAVFAVAYDATTDQPLEIYLYQQ